jgi:chaperonin GroEL (HSP60 family)
VLEIIPWQLCNNAGFDLNNILSALRKKYAYDDGNGRWYGVDIDRGEIIDAFAAGKWEPANNKSFLLASMAKAASCWHPRPRRWGLYF